MSLVHRKLLREYKNPEFEIGDELGISKYDLPFRKGYKSQFTQVFFEIVAIATRKPPTYTVKNDQDEIRGGIFSSQRIDRNHLIMESLTKKMVPNASTKYFSDNTLSSLTNFVPEAQRDISISELPFRSVYQRLQEENLYLYTQTFQTRFILWSPVFTIRLRKP